MQQYLNLLQHTLTHGVPKDDRTGTGTLSVFGYQMRFDLAMGFPLLTTKKLHTRAIVHELLWFLRGDTTIDYLRDNNVTIWDEWGTSEQCAKFGRKEGDFGPIYGHQWRNFGSTINADGTFAADGKDQITWLLDEIRRNPWSRRLIVTGWNPQEQDQVALPPCHTLFQFWVGPDSQGKPKYLSCQLYQRSADIFLGVPFNIASYALLTHMIAQVTGLVPKEFVHTLGDAHLYKNHLDQAHEQLGRTPRSLPHLILAPTITNLLDFRFEHIAFTDYDPWPAIKAPIAV